MVKAGLDCNRWKKVSGCQFKIDVVITDNKFGIMVNNPKVGETLCPRLVIFRGSNSKDGDIMPKVVQSPEKNPVIFLVCDIEVFPVKDKD